MLACDVILSREVIGGMPFCDIVHPVMISHDLMKRH